MKTVRVHQVMYFVIATICLVASAGCSKFKSSKRVNLTPYAEQMITLAADIQYGLVNQRPVYLRSFVNGPEVGNATVHMKKIRTILREMIAYSMQLVTLANSRMSNPERADALADYLDGLLRPVLAQPVPPLNFTQTKLDTILMNIRRQDKLLDALNAAQPVIDEVARASGEFLEKTKDAVDGGIKEVQKKVDAENADVRRAVTMMRKYQMSTVLNIGYLADYRRGVTSAMDTLLAREPDLKEVIESPDRVTPADLAAIEERLLYKLRAMREIREQVTPNLEIYWKQQQELDQLTDTLNAAMRKARVTFIAWARGHQRLAAGITDPAEIDLLGIAKRAAGATTVIP